MVHQFTLEVRVKFIPLNVNGQSLTSFFSDPARIIIHTHKHMRAHTHACTHSLAQIESPTSVAQAGPAVAVGDCGPSSLLSVDSRSSLLCLGSGQIPPLQLTAAKLVCHASAGRLELWLYKHF